ncbi:MAG: hypothetical protein J5892_04395 [Bacilli bacterium]|nr:hypothetical protein [Bacilli bacterium]
MKSRLAYIGNVKVKNNEVYKKSNQKVIDLINYLDNKGFNYLPNYRFNNDFITYDYIDDLAISNEEKALELIKTLAILHHKTSYYKEITQEDIRRIYDKYQNHLKYYLIYFKNYFDKKIDNEFYQPDELLLLNNYTIINDYLNLGLSYLEEWFNKVSKLNSVRLSLIHNNVNLEHLIINQNNYLISYDHAMFDLSIIDLVLFYVKYYDQFDFIKLFLEYQNIDHLEPEEILLLKVLLIINFKYEDDLDILGNTKQNTIFISYLNRVLKIIKTF